MKWFSETCNGAQWLLPIFAVLIACMFLSIGIMLGEHLHQRSANNLPTSNKTKHEQTAFELGMLSYTHKIPPWANPYKDNSGSLSWLEGWIQAKQEQEGAALKAPSQQQTP